MGKGIYVGDVAGAVGLTPQAIRFYESQGLVDRPRRTPSGYRVYSPEALERVRFIKQAQALGFTLEEIREILRLKYSGQSPCDCVRVILKQKLTELKKEIVEMGKLRREIELCLSSSRNLTRLPHEASVICPVIQSRAASKKRISRKKGGERQ